MVGGTTKQKNGHSIFKLGKIETNLDLRLNMVDCDNTD